MLSLADIRLCFVFTYSGYIFPSEHPIHIFTPGETLTLRVNISSTYSEARHIQSLTWYHNGSQICSCRTRNNGTELVIAGAKSSDAGVYQVKISALDFRRPDCDARILPVIEHLAMSAPVTFLLTQGRILLFPFILIIFLPLANFKLNSFVLLSRSDL